RLQRELVDRTAEPSEKKKYIDALGIFKDNIPPAFIFGSLVSRLELDKDIKLKDEKSKDMLELTEQGWSRVEKEFLGLPPTVHLTEFPILIHYFQAALSAEFDFLRIGEARDSSYVRNVQEYALSEDGKIVPKDKLAGQLQFGREYSNGLQQALQVKELLNERNAGVRGAIEMTFEKVLRNKLVSQQFARRYHKLGLVSATPVQDEAEEKELSENVGLELVEIREHFDPKNLIVRPTQLYDTPERQAKAIAREIIRHHREYKQGVLIGVYQDSKMQDLEYELRPLLERAGLELEVLYSSLSDGRRNEIKAKVGNRGVVVIGDANIGRGFDALVDNLLVIEAEVSDGPMTTHQLYRRAARQGRKGFAVSILSLLDNPIIQSAPEIAKRLIAGNVNSDTGMIEGRQAKWIIGAIQDKHREMSRARSEQRVKQAKYFRTIDRADFSRMRHRRWISEASPQAFMGYL
ncbi:MAG: hypothetical protein NTY47_09200, partial [Candidatus Omnitrophica bacterium]|nr:hypothetical protein [Candidatus Omnitrophota bacterium]